MRREVIIEIKYLDGSCRPHVVREDGGVDGSYCPLCGGSPLRLVSRMEIRSNFGISGVMMKFPATERHYLHCEKCDWAKGRSS